MNPRPEAEGQAVAASKSRMPLRAHVGPTRPRRQVEGVEVALVGVGQGLVVFLRGLDEAVAHAVHDGAWLCVGRQDLASKHLGTGPGIIKLGGSMMTKSPQETQDVPHEEEVDSADAKARLDLEPEEQSNAPNRQPTTEIVGPEGNDSEDPPSPATSDGESDTD
jgi:hypothetical protein